MKRTTALLIAVLMVMTLVACAPKEKDGLKNPLNGYDSLEALAEAANCAMIKPSGLEITDEEFNMIEGDVPVAEYRFTADGAECALRFADVGVETDISGMYEDGEPLLSDTESETLCVLRDEYKVQRWVTVDGQYVFEVFDNDAWEWSKFDAAADELMKMEPRTWPSDVPYADYLAISGSYNNADAGYYGAINIVRDHVCIYVLGGESVAERTYWEIDAELRDGKLVYDSEKISKITYDSESGESATEELESGGPGYAEIIGGDLVFSGAASEELNGLVLYRAENQY